MTASVPVSEIRSAIKLALGEAFDTVIGMYLDKGETLRESLDDLTAEQASVPIHPGSNSIASQVNHMNFYFDVMKNYLVGQEPERPDWSLAWKVIEVDEDQWSDLKQGLRDRQTELYGLIDAVPDEVFADPNFLAGSYGIVAHTAFHLGQIRHARAAQGL
ncbi:MAG: DinB family protein [Thermomicrobiales bacterium]|nr:DinB family protein [Thermomicrobiales bacterium]